jgi:alpha-N-acetylglucosaminidase
MDVWICSMDSGFFFRLQVRMIWRNLFWVGFTLAALLFAPEARAVEDNAAVRGLIERIAPGHADDFVLETMATPAGEDVFEVEARGGKIVLRGDGPLAQAVAFNWYLQHDAFVSVSWYADDVVKVPVRLPLPAEKIHRETKLKHRFFLNYCTFGYTMPFWRWRDWERCIDWMALHGINLPLAQTGNEYIWQKVWRDYGLSDDEIRAFFTGPAHLPWHRMVNIDKWQGPLPQSFIDGQHDLQKQILARERELGMSPVLCAFAGHVPEALKNRQPNLRIGPIPPGWAGFESKYGCWFLNPLDPKFNEIEVKFLREQAKEYGTSHFYGTDPFNEIQPPSWEPNYLASVARAIYRGMAEADPDAVWLQMGWTFHNDPGNWTNERLAAMIRAVPAGRMELIDYACEEDEYFRKTKSFFGAPFLWSYLGNFGGNTNLVGPLDRINRLLTGAMSEPNLAGVGATLEGFNNPVVYELLFDRVWAGGRLDVAAWMRAESRARAGGEDAACEQAWDVLRQKVLVVDDTIGGHGGIFQMTSPSLHDAATMLSTTILYPNADLVHAWELLLQAGPRARETSAYQRDLVDTTRQALSNIAMVLRDKMTAAYEKKDVAGFQAASDKFMTLGREMDRFLGTRTEFTLGKWIGDARSWGANPDERDYDERNARTILTTWGGALTDYAGRQWNGLMRDYYLPRWQLLIDATLAELRTGVPVDPKALEKEYRAHDQEFAATAGGSYAAKPEGDALTMSRALFDQYAALASAGPATAPGTR